MRLRSRSVAVLVMPLVLCGVAVLVAGVLFFSWQRNEEIRVVSEAAQAAHPGDRVDALIAYLESRGPALDDKNRAIWVLGELGDPRALPVLAALDRGEPCDHARFVCQYELRKAADKIRGNGPWPGR